MDLGTTISYLYEMETNNYLMQRQLNLMSREIRNLAMKPHLSSPEKKSVYVKNEMGSGDHISDEAEFIACAVLIILGIIIAITRSIACWKDEQHFFEKIVIVIGVWIFYGIVTAVAIALTSLIMELVGRSRAKKQATEKYIKAVRTYENDVKRANDRYLIEKKQKEILCHEYELLKDKFENSKCFLRRMYQSSGIDSTYWNIVAIGYMYEFYRLNISRNLEGERGLYYLVRQELRYDSFNYSLSEISTKLDTIIDQNRCLYSELKSLNNKCDNIINRSIRSAEISARNNELLKSAVSNSEITAYNTERIKRELIIRNYFLS